MPGSVLGSGDVFPAASIASNMNVAAVAGPPGVTGTFSSERSHPHASPPVATQGPLVSYCRQPGQSDTSVAGMH